MKRLVVIVLVLCFVCLFLAGCAPQATEEEIQAVDEATAVMADSRFDVGTMTDVPISLLGISEDAIQKSALYTKSTEDVAGVDAEYAIEPTQDKKIEVQVEEGKVSNVWITASGPATVNSSTSLRVSAEDFWNNIWEINNQYTLGNIEVDEEDATAESLLEALTSDNDHFCTIVWTDNEDPEFFIMAFYRYWTSTDSFNTSYVFSVV